MANNRKVQSEIDKVLKKVSEGVELFDAIWEKVYSAQNSNQKEKFEADLKKEIKKLQRYRDQIKTWIASSEIKDKKALQEARKIIEGEMERFKVCEKETKTKAYSKEGLAQAPKSDPLEEKKDNSREWIRCAINDLTDQIHSFEDELVKLEQGPKKVKKSDGGDRKTILEALIAGHRRHGQKLETILRLIDNDVIDIDMVDGIRENVEYYVESNQDPEFFDDETIYEDLDLDAAILDEVPRVTLGKSDDDLDDLDGDGKSDKSGKSDAKEGSSGGSFSTARSSEHPYGRLPPRLTTAPKSPILVGPPPSPSSFPSPAPTPAPAAAPIANLNGARSKVVPTVPPANVVAAVANRSRQSSVSSTSSSAILSPSMSPAASPKSSAALPPAQTVKRSDGIPSYAAAASAGTHSQSVDSKSSGPAGPSPVSLPSHPLVHHSPLLVLPQHPPLPQSLPSSTLMSSQPQLQSQLTMQSQLAQQQQQQQQQQHQQQQQQQQQSSIPAQHLQFHQMQAQAQAQTQAQLPQSASQLSQQAQPQPPTLPASMATLNSLSAQHPHSSLGMSQNQANRDPAPAQQHVESGTAQPPHPIAMRLQQLAVSNYFMPEPFELNKSRRYQPRTPCPVPTTFPQEPSPKFENPSLFQNFDLDTLHFSFYCQQGTYQQYLAAKELKRQSWRYHKQELKWFQRHEEPKECTDEYEHGTYVYFDWENNWCTRIRRDFKFDYKFLEDELSAPM